jgi:RHH-type proline utilization regulon transcriptional repressor/proline dehydrogenase/delta 1-pyrroline-5-carboxylate dehydrogenase
MNDPMLPERPDATAIRADFLADEARVVARLLLLASSDTAASARISARARGWVEAVRTRQAGSAGIESFLQQYDLSTQEGVLLMCVAEALLRIPDAETADRLIRDKLSRGDWQKHLGQSPSLLVNASTWGLMLTGRLTQIDAESASDPASWYERVVARAGEPVVRVAIRQAMRLMAEQFVMGRTITEAIARSRAGWQRAFSPFVRYARRIGADRRRCRALSRLYADAITAIGLARDRDATVFAQPSISGQALRAASALRVPQYRRVLAELVPSLTALAKIAKRHGIGMTIDAEEAERLELSLEIFARLRRDPALAGWEGLGLAVQAYQKRALAVIDWLIALGTECRMRIPVRLVKGAYWDTEIKRAQVLGLDSYPVFTRKAHTDVSYLACVQRMLDSAGKNGALFRCSPPTTRTVPRRSSSGPRMAASRRTRSNSSACTAWARRCTTRSCPPDKLDIACRVYAPVGSHQDLLPYLVRRLLENGANTSFVNRIGDTTVSIADIVADPAAKGSRAGRCAESRAAVAWPAVRARAPQFAGLEPRRPAGDGGAGRGIRDASASTMDRGADDRTARQRDARAKSSIRPTIAVR